MKKTLLFLAFAATILFSCGDDDSATPIVEEEKISIEDGNAVTAALNIEGSTIVEGNPPAPSTDADAPQIEDGSDAKGITGNKLIVPISEQTGSQIAGVYLKVKGSDSYFDIPASSLGNAGGRIFFGQRKEARKQKTNENVAVDIDLPDNLEPGIFCVEYCVYDAQNRVSNIVEVCIEVLEFGGANSEFISNNAWQMVSDYYKENYNGQIYEELTVVGELYTDTYTSYLYCEDGNTMEVEVENSHRTDYVYADFQTNGALAVESSYYSKYQDYENSSCQNGVVYFEETDVTSDVGGWAYDDTKKELTILWEDEWEDDGVVYTETYVQIYDVELDGSNLKISYEVIETDYSDYVEIIFEPKN